MKTVLIALVMIVSLTSLAVTVGAHENPEPPENNGNWVTDPETDVIIGCGSSGDECFYLLPDKVPSW